MASKGGGGSSAAVRAGAAYLEIFTKDTALERGLKSARAKMQSFGASVRSIGLIGAGLGGGLLASFGLVSTQLGEITKISSAADAFGLTAEKATSLFGVLRAAGSDVRDATEGMVTLGQRVSDALAGKGEEAAELFRGLGVGAEQFAGLGVDEQFYKLHESLRAVEDPAKRVQLLLKAVGEDTGKNLISTLSMTTEELREQGKLYQLNSAELKQARETTRAYGVAVAQLDMVWKQIAVSIAPIISDVAGVVGEFLKPIIQIIKNNRELVRGAVLVAAAIFAGGSAFVVLGTVVGGVGTTLGAFAAVIGLVKAAVLALFTPVGLVALALGGLGYLLLTQTEQGRAFAAGLGDNFNHIANTAVESFGSIKNALQAGRLDLAWNVVTAALEMEWARLMLTFEQAWVDFKAFFVDGWHDAILLIELAFNDLSSGLATAFVSIADSLRRTFGSVFDDVAKFVNKFPFLFGPIAQQIAEAAQAIQDGGGADAVKRNIEADRSREEDRLHREFLEAQRARDAARAEDVAAAQTRLEAARAAFERAKAEADAARLPDAVAAEEKKRPQLPKSITEFGSSKGAFQSSNFKQLLGGNKFETKQTALAEKGNELLKDIKDAVGKLGGKFI